MNCKWCGKRIYADILTSPITGRQINDFYHVDSRTSYCQDYGDGWVSEKRAVPE